MTLAVLITACLAQAPQARQQEVRPIIRGDSGTLAAKGLLAERDDDFIKHAARAGSIEIQVARLAMTRGSNVELKAFAEKLVNDHTAEEKELAQWARRKSIVLRDDDPAVKMIDKHEALQAKTGADFDREFLENIIEDHRDAIVLFSNEARNTKDAALKEFANNALATIRVHLRMAMDVKAR